MTATDDSLADGAAFFDGEGLHAQLYELLYGTVPNIDADIAFYDALAGTGTSSILDAACGNGRLWQALATPERVISGFDASATLLRGARSRLLHLPAGCKVELSRQRLESFSFAQRFDLIVLAYYSFSYLLDSASQAACLRCIAAHLAPDGRAVLHLPSPFLLMREVPEIELQALRSRRLLRTPQGRDCILEHSVSAMHYDPLTAIRSVALQLALTDQGGRLLRSESATMHYACVTAAQLAAAAAQAGLTVTQWHSGFKPGVDSELVAVLALTTTTDG